MQKHYLNVEEIIMQGHVINYFIYFFVSVAVN